MKNKEFLKILGITLGVFLIGLIIGGVLGNSIKPSIETESATTDYNEHTLENFINNIEELDNIQKWSIYISNGKFKSPTWYLTLFFTDDTEFVIRKSSLSELTTNFNQIIEKF